MAPGKQWRKKSGGNPVKKQNTSCKGRGTYSSRSSAKQMAASRMYTAGGEPIHNVQSYVDAGGKPRNSAGETIRNPTAYQNAIEASIRQNTDDPKYLYHYTNPDAATSISNSGKIQTSGNGLAGEGTYCTAKPPRCKSETLLTNNYGSATARDSSHVSNYVRVDAGSLNAEHVGGDRDVWKVDGDVDFHEHNGFVAERPYYDANDDGNRNYSDEDNFRVDGHCYQDDDDAEDHYGSYCGDY